MYHTQHTESKREVGGCCGQHCCMYNKLVCAAPQFTPLSSTENELSNYGQQVVKCDFWGFCLHQAFMSTGHLHQFCFFVVAVAALLSQMTLQPWYLLTV